MVAGTPLRPAQAADPLIRESAARKPRRRPLARSPGRSCRPIALQARARCERRCEIGWQRRADVDLARRERVRETQPVRVEELPRRGRGRRRRRRPDRRRREGRSPRGARGSGASAPSRGGPRASAWSGRSSRSSNHVTASRGVARVERVARTVAPVAADRRLDPARARARTAAHECEVAALELARAGPAPGAAVRLAERATTSSPDVSRSSR